MSGDTVALGKLFGALIEEGRFARDSPLEGGGFEPSVPLDHEQEMAAHEELRR